VTPRSLRAVVLGVLVAALLCTSPALSAEKAPPEKSEQWICVYASEMQEAVAPLAKHRAAQGMKVVTIDVADVLAENDLRKRIAGLCRAHRGRSFVLLVGAPTMRGTAGRMKGVPTDNAYGCVGEALLPTVTVGRMPARNAREAKAMVQKTLAWETDRRPGAWKRRLTVLAGAPSYNPTVDALVERLAMSSFARLDAGWTGRAIYDNAASPYALPPALLRKRALEYLAEGQLFIVYLGHSSADGFWGRGEHGLRARDWAGVKIARGAGVLATFGCYGCPLDGAEAYGLSAMRNPNGPVAVVGATGECWAAMSLLMATGMLEGLRGGPPERLGELWLAMKKHLAEAPINPLVYGALDAVDGDPQTPQATQRREHLEMFVLLGDPALRLPRVTAELRLRIEGKVAPGAELTVRADVPHASSVPWVPSPRTSNRCPTKTWRGRA